MASDSDNISTGDKKLPAQIQRAQSVSSWDFDTSFEGLVRPCLAEFLGLVIFVFVGCMAVQDFTMVPNPAYNSSTMATGPVSVGIPSAVCVAIAHGFTIALLVAGFGQVSGGHFNPAVTLGVALSGGIKPLLAVCYVGSQLVGSLVGAGLVRAVLPAVVYKTIGAGAHDLGPGVGPFSAIICETMLTLVLVLTILMCAVDRDNNVLAPLAIGFAVAVDILAGIYVTGASMNPARSFGPAVVVSNVHSVWSHHYVYWVGPALGSLIAVAFYRLFFANPQKRLIFKGEREADYQAFE